MKASARKDPDKLLERVLVFVDRNGEIVSKDSSPMHSHLSMVYKSDGLRIKMHATCYAQGNGSCGARVKYDGKLVFSACGCFTTRPFDVEMGVYEPGRWEKLIKVKP